MSSNGKKTKRLPLYHAYRFKNGDKDPIIDVCHTAMEDAGVDYNKAAELSGLSRSTIVAWIEGDTMRPQYCTVAAFMGGLGLEQKWVKARPANTAASQRSNVTHLRAAHRAA